MAITVREVLQDATSDSTDASVTTGAGTLATDLLLAVGWSSFYTLGTFGPPSGGGWTEIVTADRGTDDSKIRAWWRVATGGAQQVDLSPIIDEDVGLVVLVLAGADTAAPVDDSASATFTAPGNPSPHPAPSVSPTTADALLVCAVGTSVFDGGAAYTSPASMVERADFPVPSNAISCSTATEQLAAAGATGTRTFEYAGNNDPGLAVSVAIVTASTGVTGTLAVTEATDILAASGTVSQPAVTGSLAEVETDDTLTAVGTFTPTGIIGTVSVTEQADTLASAGTHVPPPVTGTLAITELADALVGAGTFTPEGISGSLISTEADDTLAASGIAAPPSFTGSSTVTEAADTLAASGTVVLEGIAGNLAATEANDTLAAAGTYLLATRPGATSAVAPLVPTSAVVAGKQPTVTVVPPRVPTSGGVT